MAGNVDERSILDEIRALGLVDIHWDGDFVRGIDFLLPMDSSLELTHEALVWDESGLGNNML